MMRNVCEEYRYHTQGLCITDAKSMHIIHKDDASHMRRIRISDARMMRNICEEYAQHTQRMRTIYATNNIRNIREEYA